MSDKKNSMTLPYNLDVELLEKIMNDLKNTGSEGIKQDALWRNVGAVKNSNRSYTLNTIKYLRLVETDGTDVIITSLGTKSFRFANGDDRRKILVQNLPEEYLTMFKWIQSEQELKSNEIKQKYIDSWGQPASSIVLDKSITTFLNYCQYLKLLRYIGKGNQARAVVSEFGKNVLDSVVASDSEKPRVDQQEPPKSKPQLPENSTYPIMIKTNDRDFDWDIKSEQDWAVIDSVIASIKEGWKLKQQLGNSSNHIKGKKDSIEPT